MKHLIYHWEIYKDCFSNAICTIRSFLTPKLLNAITTDLTFLNLLNNYKNCVLLRSENSWEPVENLRCPKLIKAYEDSLKKKRLGTKGKRRTKNMACRSIPKKIASVSIFVLLKYVFAIPFLFVNHLKVHLVYVYIYIYIYIWFLWNL